MPLIAPNLDDRQFADIVAEAKTLIPRYAPEWTNFNETDPGITLVELFAWMTEILVYRLNQVPDRNYVKFLQLIGIELQPARPAKTTDPSQAGARIARRPAAGRRERQPPAENRCAEDSG